MVNLLATRRGRHVLFGALYLSEGGPIGFIWWALPTKLRAAGVDVGSITTLTSILVIPWIFKFLWSPLIDGVQTPRWNLRSWILSMQLLMGCSLIPLLFWDLETNLAILVPFLLLHAVAAATQDASIDALAISTVPDKERGSVNGWMQLGMLVGRSALGGGALLLEQRIGPTAVIVLLVAVIWSSSTLVLLSRLAPISIREEGGIRERLRALLPRLRAASRNRATWFGLLFALIAGSGFEAVGGVAGPFMIDRGLSSEEVGGFFALHSVLAMGAGAIIGGYVADRLGKRTAVSVFLLLTAACIFTLAALDAGVSGRAGEWMVPTMTLLYGCIGLFTASSYALFMEISDPALGATQFSAFMGATNGCESWATFAVGRTIPAVGYPAAFSLMAAVSLTALPLLRFLSPRGENTQTTG